MVKTKLEELKNNFWTSIEELAGEIEDVTGAFVEDWCSEYIVISYEEDDEDVQVDIRLNVAGRTITIESFEEVYRG